MTNSKRILLALVAVEITLIAIRVIGRSVLPLYDDAFITFRYARNFASGAGLVYHPNEWVLGLTGPLYSLVVSVFYLLSLPIWHAVTGMNIAFDAITLFITFLILAKGREPLAAVLFGLFFAVSPIMTRICAGGMEANLFLLCSVVSIFLYHRGAKKAAIMLAAASYYLRPEAALLVAVLLATEVISHRKKPSERYRAVWLTLLALVVVVPPLFLLYRYYGHILPQSVLAKTGRSSSLAYVIKNLLIPDPQCFVLLPLAIWGFVGVMKQEGFVRTYAIWGIAYLLAYLAGRPDMWSWYGAPVHYALFVLAAAGCARLLRRLLERELPPQWIAAAGGICATATWLLVLAIAGRSAVTTYLYEPLDLWCRQDGNLEHSSILASDIGAVGYFSNARIYDTAGLVWPQALSISSAREIIETRHPDYVFLNRTASNMEMMDGEPLRKSYRLTETFLVPNNVCTIFKFKKEWIQEYMIFEKVGE